MEPTGNFGIPPSQQVLETLARTLRHEVGDLLQTIYSTVAILQDRLPRGQDLERRLLNDLKGRAANCKQELDGVVDLICPLTLSTAPTDLAELVRGLLSAFQSRYTALHVHYEGPASVPVTADARRLSQVGNQLLLSACQAAQQNVWVRLNPRPAAGEVEWTIRDDGYGAAEDQLIWLNQPFATTHHAQFGVALALARRVAEAHGGRLTADNLPEGGFQVSLLLPVGKTEVNG